MFKHEIKIIKTSENDFLTYKITKCDFCEETSLVYNQYYDIYQKIKKNNSYCSFCLRNEFYKKNQKDIIILTFNPIIKKYYKLYLKRVISYYQILNFVECHKNTGLLHPAFYYDDYSLKWFINLNKTNNNDLLKHILNILCCFNINYLSLNVSSIIKKINNYKSNKQKCLIIGGNKSNFKQNNIIQI